MESLIIAKESPEQVRFRNAIFDTDREYDFQIGDEPYRLEFHANFKPIDPKISFQVEGSESGKLWVVLSDTSYLTGLEDWLGDARLDQLPDEVAAIVLDGGFSELLDNLGASVGESFEITEVRSKEAPCELNYTLPFILTNSADRQTRGMLLFEVEWAPTIKSLISFVPTALSNKVDSVKVPLPIELGRSWLTVAELNQLERFDIVMVDQSDFLSRHRATLAFSDALQIHCESENGELVVKEVAAKEHSQHHATTGSLDCVDDLRLPMSIHAGWVQPTLGQLRGLATEDKLKICSLPRKSIDVMVADQLFGTGELVQSSERLGVRLVTLERNRLAGI